MYITTWTEKRIYGILLLCAQFSMDLWTRLWGRYHVPQNVFLVCSNFTCNWVFVRLHWRISASLCEVTLLVSRISCIWCNLRIFTRCYTCVIVFLLHHCIIYAVNFTFYVIMYLYACWCHGLRLSDLKKTTYLLSYILLRWLRLSDRRPFVCPSVCRSVPSSF